VIDIHLNGETRSIDAATDLAALVEQLSLVQKRIAVELNGSVIRRIDWPQTPVNEGDKIEVVHFVGGG
jgi:thiamine biosynthesis protein ThiS